MSSKSSGFEETIQILAKKARVGVLVLEDDYIVMANQTIARMHGCKSPSEFIGRDIFSLGHFSKSEFEKVHRNSKLGLNHGKVFCWEGMGIGGRKFRIEARPSKIMWYGRPAVFSIAFDLNEPNSHRKAGADAGALCDLQDRLTLGMIGQSKAMTELFNKISMVSQVDLTVLILGETGSGKELVARAIHDCSHRYSRNFIAVNSNAINEHLFESEFFGHRKGAFSGAFCDKTGYFDASEGGTLFLDEIGDLSKEAQAKLLRVIDTGEYMPVGCALPKKSNARIILATNLDPVKLVENGLMREDFFYRIHNLIINVPPLRDRLDDIPLLIEHFHEQLAPGNTTNDLSEKIVKAFLHYHWPGNVRELRNAVGRYLSFGQIYPLQDFSYSPPRNFQRTGNMRPERRNLKSAVQNLEKEMIAQALVECAGNQSKAAEYLGVPKRSFVRKVQKYSLN